MNSTEDWFEEYRNIINEGVRIEESLKAEIPKALSYSMKSDIKPSMLKIFKESTDQHTNRLYERDDLILACQNTQSKGKKLEMPKKTKKKDKNVVMSVEEIQEKEAIIYDHLMKEEEVLVKAIEKVTGKLKEFEFEPVEVKNLLEKEQIERESQQEALVIQGETGENEREAENEKKKGNPKKTQEKREDGRKNSKEFRTKSKPEELQRASSREKPMRTQGSIEKSPNLKKNTNETSSSSSTTPKTRFIINGRPPSGSKQIAAESSMRKELSALNAKMAALRPPNFGWEDSDQKEFLKIITRKGGPESVYGEHNEPTAALSEECTEVFQHLSGESVNEHLIRYGEYLGASKARKEVLEKLKNEKNKAKQKEEELKELTKKREEVAKKLEGLQEKLLEEKKEKMEKVQEWKSKRIVARAISEEKRVDVQRDYDRLKEGERRKHAEKIKAVALEYKTLKQMKEEREKSIQKLENQKKALTTKLSADQADKIAMRNAKHVNKFVERQTSLREGSKSVSRQEKIASLVVKPVIPISQVPSKLNEPTASMKNKQIDKFEGARGRFGPENQYMGNWIGQGKPVPEWKGQNF